VLAFQITYRGIKIATYVTRVYIFIYHIVQYFSTNMFFYVIQTKRRLLHKIYTPIAFAGINGLHFYSTRVRYILTKPLNSRMIEAVPIRPTDFNEHMLSIPYSLKW